MTGRWRVNFGAWERLTDEQQSHVIAIVAECGGEWSRSGLLAFRDHKDAMRCSHVVATRLGLAPQGPYWGT